MAARFKFQAPMKPTPWKRTVTKRNGKRANPESMRKWQSDFAYIASFSFRGSPMTDPLELRAVFITKRPRTLKKDKDSRIFRPKVPDIDNLVKNVLDALVYAGVLADDKYIVAMKVIDVYGRQGEKDTILVELWDPDPEMLSLI